MEKHLTEADFERYQDGETGIFEKIRFYSHINSCRECQKLEHIVNNRKKFLDEFRHGISRMKEAEERAESICMNSDKNHRHQ